MKDYPLFVLTVLFLICVVMTFCGCDKPEISYSACMARAAELAQHHCERYAMQKKQDSHVEPDPQPKVETEKAIHLQEGGCFIFRQHEGTFYESDLKTILSAEAEKRDGVSVPKGKTEITGLDWSYVRYSGGDGKGDGPWIVLKITEKVPCNAEKK